MNGRPLVRFVAIAFALGATFHNANAYPGFVDGAKLKLDLESAFRVWSGNAEGDDVENLLFVVGYISGIVDALNNDTSGHFFCQPPNVTPQRDAEIILDYIKSRGDSAYARNMLRENATLYIFDALGTAFPCKRN
jgi:hypothetical protein